MTVVHLGEGHMGANNRPDWCKIVGMGAFRIKPDAMFDRHFHDSPEYWMFYEGKGKVTVGDETFYVNAGDVVCTPPGSSHDIVEIYEELEGFYLEEPLPEGGTIGHQHEGERDSVGHRIPLVALPDDFPPATRAGITGA
jgi:cupin domain